MIWFTIALFVVSFLVTALLAPKPEIEDARAGALDDIQFPRATEDAPVPLVLGKVRLNSPNTIWYGDYSSIAITQKVKTGLFSSKHVVVGHKYYLGLDLGLCLGDGVSLSEIWIDEEQTWTGSTSSTVPTTGTINELELFGGYKGGGGWSGGFTFYPGTFPGVVNSYQEGVVGVGEVPGYGGLAHIVFENNYIGENNQLRKMGFVLEKYSNGLGTVNSGKVGDDMNPMEALYQICIDEWVGLGVSTANIDTANWINIASTLHTEGNGVSVLVTSAQSGKAIIKEILRQIDGIMFQDPTTGKLKVKLIRDDYDPALLDVYDEDDILKVRSFSKTAWEDVVGQVKVSFPQRDKESSAVAISQDMATANMIGRMKTVSMSFPFCFEPTLANQIASRERAQSSVPLFRMTLEMNRNAYNLRPGAVFRISWPEYGLSELVMRVQKHDLGELLNNKIVVDCIQDAFAVGTVVFSDPETSSWVAPVTRPTDILTATVIDTPIFFGRKMENIVAEQYSQPLAIPLRPSTGSTHFTMQGGIVSGTLDIDEPDFAEHPATGTLSANYDRETGQATGIDATGFTLNSRLGTFDQPIDSADMLQGNAGLLYIEGEWIGFLNVTNNASTAVFTNVYRGLFGSSVVDHASGARAYQVNLDAIGDGVAGLELLNTETWYYKLLDAVGGNRQDPDSVVSESTFNPSDVMRKPLRPRNLALDTSRANYEVTDSDGDMTLTWNATDRETGNSFPHETAVAETPPETTTYDIRVYFGGVEEVALRSLDTAGSSYIVPFTTLLPPQINTDCEIRVWARINDPDLPGVDPDYLSDGYASLTFSINIPANNLLTEGDIQSGTDNVLLEGDMQSGTDILTLEGDEA
jgi:hypothetical protein